MNKEHNDIKPPGILLRFLRWFCDPELLEDVEGDLIELFHIRSKSGTAKAKLLFTLDVLFLLRPGIIRNFTINVPQNTISMFRNHLTTAFRHSKKYKGYTLINILGLVIGLASSIMILLWVMDEVRMDRFHAKSDRIYQVWRNMHQAGGVIATTPGIPQPLESVLENEYQEVDQVTLLGWEIELLFRNEDEVSYEKGRYASPEFFGIFSFPLLAGDPGTALENIHSVVISESMAVRFFGNDWKENALGRMLKIDEREEFTITGVFADPGKNSSLDFDWILPAEEYIKRNDWVESWFNGGFRIFISLRDAADIGKVQQRIEQEINRNTEQVNDERLFLQKFSDNYLYSIFENGRPVSGRIQYVRMMTGIAIFMLVIACINFMNLATARSSRRSREIGLRKVFGAGKGILRQQFFVESFLHTVVSVLVALVIVRLLIPPFNEFTGKSLALDFSSLQVWYGLIAIILVTGLLSGSYPAIVLPSIKTGNTLKKISTQSSPGRIFRNSLVVFQFTLSIVLIIGTIIITRQLDYILNKNLGLEKENLIMTGLEGDLVRRNEIYKTELLNIPEVKNVTFASGNPLYYGSSTGSARWDGKDPDDVFEINVLNADEDFFNTMGMKIIKGRSFSADLVTDTANYIVNEVMAGIMGFENPVGQRLSVWRKEGLVVGIVKNFHLNSLYEPIEPLIIRYDPNGTNIALIRVQEDIPEALKEIERVTGELNPSYPFRYEFLDRGYEQTYRSEMTVGMLVRIFAVISIIISCLGLFGLSSYSADQRSREIGIRRVHGADTISLVLLLSKNYTRLVLIAFILSVPLAYFYGKAWLENFAFRIDLNFFMFILAGTIAFIVGALTVSLKSYQAALTSPVKTLRDD